MEGRSSSIKKIVAVECYADKLFFERLLRNEQIIIKEKNKPEVLKGIKERSKGIFRIGIVDDDNERIERFIGNEKINRFKWEGYGLEIIQLESKCHYIIQLSPNEFEDFIVRYLREFCNKDIEDFGYKTLKDFKSESKSIYQKLIIMPRINNLYRYIFETYKYHENSISKLKRILDYLIDKKYNVDFNELKNV
jgi:hypothetical protein